MTLPAVVNGSALRRALMLIPMALTAGCSTSEPASKPSPAPYLFVWAGPHMGDTVGGGTSNFMAVLDADPASAAYGQVLTSQEAGVAGMMAHHMELTLPTGQPVFADDYLAGRIVLVDVADPMHPRVVRQIDSVPGYRRPHSFARLPNGHVLATLQFGDGTLPGDPGGLAEFDTAGTLLQTGSSANSAFTDPPIRTYGLDLFPSIDRVVTTSSPMEMVRTANVIQVWRLSDLRLLQTIVVPPLAGDSVDSYPFEIRALPDGKTALFNTYYCGFYLVTGLDSATPQLTLVHSMREPRRVGCSVPTIVGRYWVMPVAYDHSVISLDIADPAHPVEVSVLRADSTFLPHWSSADPGSDRIVITGQDDGEPRVLIARLDPATGQLSWDEGFRDAGSARLGVSFDRPTWPHGSVDHAMPHGALFGPASR